MRSWRSSVWAVAFLSILIALVVSILVAYLIFVLAGPGVFGSLGGRTIAWRALLDALYVGGVAWRGSSSACIAIWSLPGSGSSARPESSRRRRKQRRMQKVPAGGALDLRREVVREHVQ